MASSTVGTNGIDTDLAGCAIPSTLVSLTSFNNANMVHQKRLKVNNSQLTKCSNDFNTLKAQYQQMQTTPPTTTVAERNKVLTKLKDLCQRYQSFIDNRREIIGEQDAMLEQSLDVPHIMYTDELGQALDMQIATTQALLKLADDQPLEAELMRLMREHIPKPFVKNLPEAPHQGTEGTTDLAKAMIFFNNRLRPAQTRLDHAKVSVSVVLNRYKPAVNFGVPVPYALAQMDSEFEEAVKQYREMWMLQHDIVKEYKAAIEAASDSMDMSDEYAEAFQLHNDSVAALGSGEVATFRARMKAMKA